MFNTSSIQYIDLHVQRYRVYILMFHARMHRSYIRTRINLTDIGSCHHMETHFKGI